MSRIKIVSPAIPEQYQPFAHKRLQAWLEKLLVGSEPIELAEQEAAQKLLLMSDYIERWSLLYPQWLLQGIRLPKASLLENLQVALDNLSQEPWQELSEYQVKQKLRLFRQQWSVLIACHDLLQKDSIKVISQAQSLMANQLIRLAYHYLYQQLCKQYGTPHDGQGNAQQLYILAMGKLGGMELNFSSDIDLIFCYPEEGQTDRAPKPLENLTFFTRLGQRLVSLLAENTQEGFVYRVDMRLRPYGQSGDLVLSFERMEDYYLEQGREWERFAMIKAAILEPLSGASKESITRLENIIRPFSFRRYIDFGVLDSIRKLKQKISSEVLNKDLRFDIKLGQGGIRELEFIVQSYQLISGGRNPQLQVKGWWQSLECLQALNLISQQQAETLFNAYNFLRRLENCLQIKQEKQTQQLPSLAMEQSLLAFAMGYSNWQELAEDIRLHRENTEAFFDNLFKDPTQETFEDDGFSLATKLLDSFFVASQEDSFQQQLQQQAWQFDSIELLARFKKDYVEQKLGERGQRRMLLLLPHLLIEAHNNRHPKLAIERTLEVLQGIGRRSAYFEMLAENLPLLNQLIKLVCHSSWLARQIAIYPSLLDELLFPSSFGEQLSKQTFNNLLQQNMLRIEPEQLEEQLVALANFKQTALFKVAIGDLNQGFNIQQVSQQLTDIAEVILEYTLNLAWRDLYKKHGGPENTSIEQASGFQIIGYGKLGGDELGYSSDLDLVFLYSGKPQALTDGEKPVELQQFYTRLAQRLVHLLSARTQQGLMYEVDTRLRPSGRSGLLVSHIESFEKYQQEEAWTWEHQALVRARPLNSMGHTSGNQLLKRYNQCRLNVLAQARDWQELLKQIVEMREKMRTNLDTSDDQSWNIKHGQGGLVDIEFMIQYWVLKYSPKLKAEGQTQLPYNNVDWLKILSQQGCIKTKYATCLLEHYRLFRQVSNFKALQMEKAQVPQTELQEPRAEVMAIWQEQMQSQQ